MLTIHEISKQYGSKELFREASAFLGAHRRVALVGPNGAGKTTLIRFILGQETPDAGTISRAKDLTIGYLAQEVHPSSHRTPLQEVMEMDGRRQILLKRKADFEAAFAAGGDSGPSDESLEQYSRTIDELESLDEYRLESQAKKILTGMGFTESQWNRPLSSFSGGWLMRVALSRLLLMKPSLLVLDEPTNHLDLEALLWLEGYLKRYEGALLIVSHDRFFLNKLVDEVWDVDQKVISCYTGNLDSYLEQKKIRREQQLAAYERQQEFIAKTEAFIDRFGAKATKASQAQSRQKQLDKLERIELSQDASKVRFRFPEAPHSGRDVLSCSGVDFGFEQNPHLLFQGLNWVLQRGRRYAIVGVNGVGKTTLLRLLAGELQPRSGTLRYGHEVQVGYYAQHQAESLDLNKTVFQELLHSAPHADLPTIRAVAGSFLFSGDSIEKKCGVLSGGEKARVALAKLLLNPSNLLILDEPTNHLDRDSKFVLLEALKGFSGTIVLVSHDREFLEPLANQVLEISAKAMPSTGSICPAKVDALVLSYAEYVERKAKAIEETGDASEGRSSASRVQPVAAGAQIKRESAARFAQRRQWERDRDKTLERMAKAEAEMAELDKKLADVEFCSHRQQLEDAMKLRSKKQDEVHSLMSQWENLENQLAEAE